MKKPKLHIGAKLVESGTWPDPIDHGLQTQLRYKSAEAHFLTCLVTEYGSPRSIMTERSFCTAVIATGQYDFAVKQRCDKWRNSIRSAFQSATKHWDTPAVGLEFKLYFYELEDV